MNLALIIGGLLAYFLYQKQQAQSADSTVRPPVTGPTGIMTTNIAPQEVQTGIAVGPIGPIDHGPDIYPPPPPITGPDGIMIRADQVLPPQEGHFAVDPAQSSLMISATGQGGGVQLQPPPRTGLPALSKVRQDLIDYMTNSTGGPYGAVEVRGGDLWDTPMDFNWGLMNVVPGVTGGAWVPSIAQLWPDKFGATSRTAAISFSEYWSKAGPWLQQSLGLSGLGAFRTHGGWGA